MTLSQRDREKWNAKYRDVREAPREPSPLVTSLADHLPAGGRAIDVAGGAGRHAIWLAQRDFDVTLADTSEVGLQLASQRSKDVGVSIQTRHIDLEVEPFPAGPWDVILSFQFLWRPLFDVFPAVLNPGGLLIVIQPTRSNLLRHAKPPARFLLDDGELPQLVKSLKILHYEEGWLAEGRHDAVVVAARRE